MDKIFLENIPDLAESQRMSFFHFLYRGITAELKAIDNPITDKIRSDKLPEFAKVEIFKKLDEEDKEKKLEINRKGENKDQDKDNFSNEDQTLKQKKHKKKKTIEIPKEFSKDPNFFYFSKNVKRIAESPGEIYFSPEKVKLKGPYQNFEAALFTHSTYSLQAFVRIYYSPFPIHLRVNDRYKKLRIEKDVLLAEIPLITDEGSFLITGVERIVINQIIRSPGVYFRKEYGTSKKFPKVICTATLISDRGMWTKIIMDNKSHLVPESNKSAEIYENRPSVNLDHIYVKLNDLRGQSALESAYEPDHPDSKSALSIFEFLKYWRLTYTEAYDALNYPPTDEEKRKLLFLEYFKELDELTRKTIDKIFFNKRTGIFSIGQTGRFKINKKLGLNLPKDTVYLSPLDTLEIINNLLALKYNDLPVDDIDHIKNKQIRSVGDFLQMQLRIGLAKSSSSQIKNSPYASFKSEGEADDDLILPLDEEDGIFAQMRAFDAYTITSSLKEFFKISQLSQFMDQINPLSQVTQKRKISVFGPNGLKRDHISTPIRDIHPSQYGRLCPIETPEGENAGLITSIATYARMNAFGWLETPYYLLKDSKLNREDSFFYLGPYQESEAKIAFCDTALLNDQTIAKEELSLKVDTSFIVQKRNEVQFLTTSPLQLLSLATTLIPFIEHDDANRALMGSNMQRQAVPLLSPQKPIVGTGMEISALIDSGSVIKSYAEGYVKESNSVFIDIIDFESQCIRYYLLKAIRSNQETFTNQKPSVWLGEKVFSGQVIADASSSIDGELALGQNLTVAYMPWEGYNYEDAIVLSERLVFEDCLTSIHIQEYETSITGNKEKEIKRIEHLQYFPKKLKEKLDKHGVIKVGTYVKEYQVLIGNIIRNYNASPERTLESKILNQKYPIKDISFKLPPGVEGRLIEIRISTPYSKVTNLAEIVNKFDSSEVGKEGLSIEANELIKLGSLNELEKNEKKIEEKEDKLTLKIKETKKQTKNKTIKEDSFTDFEGNKEENNLNESVISEQEITSLNSKKLRFFIAQRRKIEIGDKLAGRHGNKGIVSRILPTQDMPYLPNGRPIDIILNPLGVPSRMNVGQIFECLLGLAGENLGKRFKVKAFDEIYGEEASRILVTQKLKEASVKSEIDWLFSGLYPGKILLRDGRTGEYFDNPITVGKAYILKLVHLVQDKIHARDSGPYSMITEQPLAGKALKGGQRLGEMEVWALEAYGASYTLQELLTVKSDDIEGRNDMYTSMIIPGYKDPVNTSVPEGFLMLIRELNALGLDFSLKKLRPEISILGDYEYINEFVDIFKKVETRLKLKALYNRKRKFLNQDKLKGGIDESLENKRDLRGIDILISIRNRNFSNLLNTTIGDQSFVFDDFLFENEKLPEIKMNSEEEILYF